VCIPIPSNYRVSISRSTLRGAGPEVPAPKLGEALAVSICESILQVLKEATCLGSMASLLTIASAPQHRSNCAALILRHTLPAGRRINPSKGDFNCQVRMPLEIQNRMLRTQHRNPCGRDRHSNDTRPCKRALTSCSASARSSKEERSGSSGESMRIAGL